jgi:hypothetical protein
LGLISSHQGPTTRVPYQDHRVNARYIEQPTHAGPYISYRVVEQKVCFVSLEFRVPTEKPNPAVI